MQCWRLIAVLALCVVHARAETKKAQNPVARVVGLLKGLQVKLQTDFDAEKSLFAKYECWYKSITSSKTASNTAAQSRKESLETYIQDIEAGKFEFTTERVDLEKQIAGLKQDLQVAEDLRNKENEDFQAAKAEMEKAVSALQSAIEVLETAAPSSLLARRSTVSLFKARQSLDEVVLIGRSALASADVELLERIIVGDAPEVDWKKLNREATFKMKYTSQTARIVKTLKELKATFEQSLLDAQNKENHSKASYDTLKGSKDVMVSRAEQSLVEMVAEHGARDMTKSEAQAEVDALGAQITADIGFMSQTETAYQTKKQEWTNRERLRNMEIAAISEAIAVLHSDEARDTLKTSYSFLQALKDEPAKQQGAKQKHLVTGTLQSLRKLADTSGDSRVSALVQRSSTRSIAAVITQIGNLVTTLRAEENTDLTNKENCETQRAEKTRQAKTQSVAIDDFTEEIVRAKAKVEELEGQMQEQNEIITDHNRTLVELERQRTDENAQYSQDKADDQAAIQLIQQATAVLDKLKQDLLAGIAVGSKVRSRSAKDSSHQDLATSFLGRVVRGSPVEQQSKVRAPIAAVERTSSLRRLSSGSKEQPVEIKAGEAAPPPPATWANPTYTGSVDHQKGIHAILTLLQDDIQADISTADQAELDAETAYNKQKGDLEAAMQAAKDAITAYEGEKATQDQTIVNKGIERSSKKAELQGTLGEIAAMTPGCDFILVNFELRRTNRQVEIDGLLKAKAFLQGADFS